MLAAIRNIDAQLTLVWVLKMAGPCTTSDLLAFAMPHVAQLSMKRLQRLLTGLRKAGGVKNRKPTASAVTHSATPVWCLPGQAPTPEIRREERRATIRPAKDRRKPVEHGSWWAADMTREAFSAAVRQRWA